MKNSENKQFRQLLHKNIHIKKDMTDKLLIADFEIHKLGQWKIDLKEQMTEGSSLTPLLQLRNL
jgi:hypothetical protein